MSYNLVKACFTKTDNGGKTKAVTEQYLVDCLSKTEGEARIIGELSPLYSDLQVKSIGDTRISEIFGDKECGRFWLAKVAFITIDERTAAEKRTVVPWLIGADNFNNAYNDLRNEIDKSVADIEIVSLAETQIKDYYPTK